MTQNHWITLPCLLGTLSLAGCGSVPERALSTEPPAYALLPNGNDPMNPDQPSPLYRQAASGADGNLVRSVERLKPSGSLRSTHTVSIGGSMPAALRIQASGTVSSPSARARSLSSTKPKSPIRRASTKPSP